MKKTQERWHGAHERLKELFAERVTMTQEDFGTTYGLGTQGMVWQYLNGHRPLNYEAAAKFARGMGCTIADISPEMADEVRREILPVLGRPARAVAKAAMWLILAVPPLLPLLDGVRSCVLCKIKSPRRQNFAKPVTFCTT